MYTYSPYIRRRNGDATATADRFCDGQSTDDKAVLRISATGDGVYKTAAACAAVGRVERVACTCGLSRVCERLGSRGRQKDRSWRVSEKRSAAEPEAAVERQDIGRR